VPDWVTVYVLPAIVSVPVRVAVDEFVATMKVTVPLPRPGPEWSTATHATLLIASHSHAVLVVTVALPNPPSEVNQPAVDEIDGVQALGVVCVTVKVVPAIVNVPVRNAVPVFGATVNATLPDPEPVVPAIMVIHDVVVLDSQSHPTPALTRLMPVPPPPANVWLVGDAL
jgi:hypothetical protein